MWCGGVALLSWCFWWDFDERVSDVNVLLAFIGLTFVGLFHAELKRSLAALDPTPRHTRARVITDDEVRQLVIHETSKAADSLSKGKSGALIVIEQSADLTEFLKDGVEINAYLRASLIHAIFSRNGNDFHDGALVIRQDHIWQAKAFLSMPHSLSLSQEYGTRHLAAVGVSEETDAVVVVVSEERGTISVAYAGTLQTCKDRKTLEEKLEKLIR